MAHIDNTTPAPIWSIVFHAGCVNRTAKHEMYTKAINADTIDFVSPISSFSSPLSPATFVPELALPVRVSILFHSESGSSEKMITFEPGTSMGDRIFETLFPGNVPARTKSPSFCPTSGVNNRKRKAFEEGVLER